MTPALPVMTSKGHIRKKVFLHFHIKAARTPMAADVSMSHFLESFIRKPGYLLAK